MFERFSEQARQVVVLAQEEARALSHNYIGTEHLLLGLLHEDDTVSAHVLASLGVTLAEARAQVVRIVGTGDEPTSGQIPFTPRAKRILEISLRESLALGHTYIGTEHILLALVREHEGVAMRVLIDFDADAATVRNEVLRRVPSSQNRDIEVHPERGPAVRISQFRYTIGPDAELRRLLMAAAGRALEDQREEFGLADLLAAAERPRARPDPTDPGASPDPTHPDAPPDPTDPGADPHANPDS